MASKKDIEKYYTPAEMAELFRVDSRTVTRWARSGAIPAHAISRTPGGHRRFKASVIDALYTKWSTQ